MAQIIEIEGLPIGVVENGLGRQVTVPKGKPIKTTKPSILTVPKGTKMVTEKGTEFTAKKKSTVKVPEGTKVTLPKKGAKAPAEGKKPTEEEGGLKGWWNKLIGNIRDAAAKFAGLKTARAAAEAKIKILKQVAPKVKDARWQAAYSKLAANYAKLTADTDKKILEFETKKKETNTALDEAKKGGEVGLGPFALAGIAAAVAILIGAAVILAKNWREMELNAKVLIEDDAAKRAMSDAEREVAQTEAAKVDATKAEMDKVDDEYTSLEKAYQDAKRAGDEEKAKQILSRMDELKKKKESLLEVITRPMPTLPTAPTPAAVVKAEEKAKSKLEEWLGLSPGMIMGIVAIMFLLPRVVESGTRAYREVRG
jgi:hypothetical protein